MGKNMMAAIVLLALSLAGCGGGSGGSSALPTVTFNTGVHGTLTGTTSQTVATGSATSAVTAVPAAGYYFVNWTGDNGYITSAANPLTVTNVTANQNITANFVIDPSSAVLKLSSVGALPTGTSLSGISVKVQLPAGVTVSADAGNTAKTGVVTASGVAAASSVTIIGYTPATATTPATLEFLIISNTPGGFGVGEFATVNCVIASGNFPTASGFILPATDFKPANLQLLYAAGLTATLTADIN